MSASPTMEKEGPVESQEDGGSSGAEEVQPTRRAPRRQRKNKKQPGGGSALDQLPVSGLEGTAENALGGVTNTLGGLGGKALDQSGGEKESGGGGKSDTLRLRLDLNLEIEIQLKARIHGDLELALLTG
jgi:hypothetical protein